MLWPTIEAGRVDALLVEISPVFHDGYPVLVERLVTQGYRAYIMPRLRHDGSAVSLTLAETEGSLLDDLRLWRLDDTYPTAERLRAEVASWHQENVLFIRRYAGEDVST